MVNFVSPGASGSGEEPGRTGEARQIVRISSAERGHSAEQVAPDRAHGDADLGGNQLEGLPACPAGQDPADTRIEGFGPVQAGVVVPGDQDPAPVFFELIADDPFAAREGAPERARLVETVRGGLAPRLRRIDGASL